MKPQFDHTKAEKENPSPTSQQTKAARCGACGSLAFNVLSQDEAVIAQCVECGQSSQIPTTSREAQWRKSIAAILAEAPPVSVVESINQTMQQMESRRRPELVAAFERDRLRHDGSGFDQWAATLVAFVWSARMHREGVQAGRMKPSPEADTRAVDAASEIALHSLDAFASWCPEFFDGIAKWMRECRDKHTRPTWGTIAREVVLRCREQGLDLTKAELKPRITQLMHDAAGTHVPEPTKWADVWKDCGIRNLREGKAGRPKKSAKKLVRRK